MTPIDHTSIYVEYSLMPNNNSGALYHNVTTTAAYNFQLGYGISSLVGQN